MNKSLKIERLEKYIAQGKKKYILRSGIIVCIIGIFIHLLKYLFYHTNPTLLSISLSLLYYFILGIILGYVQWSLCDTALYNLKRKKENNAHD